MLTTPSKTSATHIPIMASLGVEGRFLFNSKSATYRQIAVLTAMAVDARPK
jgi:hypothetical protein